MDLDRNAVDAIFRALQGEAQVGLGPGVAEAEHWRGPGVTYRERDLATALRKPGGPAIVVVEHLGPTLLRAVREAPPALLVWTGEDSSQGELGRELAQRGWLLGPGARVTWPAPLPGGRCPRVIVAHGAEELEGLRRTLRLGHEGPSETLALCPTPPWLVDLLLDPRWAEAQVLGTLAAATLHAGWVAWARSHERHVLVPVGVGEPDLERPNTLPPLVAAQALERWTGPVFPSPRVITAIAAGLDRLRKPGSRPATVASAAALAVWDQARRALPWLGDAPGMETPSRDDPLEAPTSSFLAQAALLRARARLALRGRDIPVPTPAIEGEGLPRALEVLRAAGEHLSDQESKVVLRGFGVEVTRQAVSNSASGASGFAERIGFPVVLKALSPDLRRRAEVGGILLNLETAAAVRRGYATIVDNIERQAPTAHLDGVLVAEMIPEGLDLRCGGRRLADGTFVLYGRVELPTGLRPEVSLALGPLDPQGAAELAQAVLQGGWVPTRRRDDPDPLALGQLFLALSALLEQTEDRILTLDLGPVRWVGSARGYVTLDASIVQRPHLQGL